MNFDWISFLKSEGLPYITQGKNVARGHVNVKCPMCGAADPSEHMGISVEGKGWACWRNEEHRGRSPVTLIAALLNCSKTRAKEIAGQDEDRLVLDSFSSLRDRAEALDSGARRKKIPTVVWPSEMNLIKRTTTQALRYLETRKFNSYRGEAYTVAHMYSLRFAYTGRMAMRLIFPLTVKKRLVGWTGRDVTGSKELRYSTWPIGSDAVAPRVIYNHSEVLEGGNVLAVCEGPMDALKLDWYGRDFGVRAVALLGLDLSPSKLAALLKLSKQFDRIALVLDAAALRNSLSMTKKLALFGKNVIRKAAPGKDPGALSPASALAFCESLRKQS